MACQKKGQDTAEAQKGDNGRHYGTLRLSTDTELRAFHFWREIGGKFLEAGQLWAEIQLRTVQQHSQDGLCRAGIVNDLSREEDPAVCHRLHRPVILLLSPLKKENQSIHRPEKREKASVPLQGFHSPLRRGGVLTETKLVSENRNGTRPKNRGFSICKQTPPELHQGVLVQRIQLFDLHNRRLNKYFMCCKANEASVWKRRDTYLNSVYTHGSYKLRKNACAYKRNPQSVATNGDAYNGHKEKDCSSRSGQIPGSLSIVVHTSPWAAIFFYFYYVFNQQQEYSLQCTRCSARGCRGFGNQRQNAEPSANG
jgi:hypothetical protein